MRLIVRFDEGLVQEALQVAARSGETFTKVVEDALRESLARRRALATRGPVELPSSGGGGLLPGVDLDDPALS